MYRRQNITGPFLLTCMCVLGFSMPVAGQENAAQSKGQQGDMDQAELFKKFEETLTGSKLVGNFTILGQDNSDLTPEEYHIKSVRKMPEGDIWMFIARIKYGGKDRSVPMPLTVKWAGNTPIITLDNFAVPGMGTFDARVIIHKNKYAGTWSHDEVGGHLFGTIVPDAAEGVEVKDDDSSDDDSNSDK